MRIIGGSNGGRKLKSPPGAGVRPTSDRVREALFNILQRDIAGARFLDLYAGSGAIGLEALSRGAASTTFVEEHPARAKAIRNVLDQLGWTDRARVNRLSARQFLEGHVHTFEIVFADPPYDSEELDWLKEELIRRPCLAENGILVLEHPSSRSSDFVIWNSVEARQYRYGDTGLSVYRLEDRLPTQERTIHG